MVQNYLKPYFQDSKTMKKLSINAQRDYRYPARLFASLTNDRGSADHGIGKRWKRCTAGKRGIIRDSANA